MSGVKKSKQAFPCVHPDGSGVVGLTKREYFASQIMAGVLANRSLLSAIYFESKRDGILNSEGLSKFCVGQAIMLEETLELVK